jgi:hypothetical protein
MVEEKTQEIKSRILRLEDLQHSFPLTENEVKLILGLADHEYIPKENYAEIAGLYFSMREWLRFRMEDKRENVG